VSESKGDANDPSPADADWQSTKKLAADAVAVWTSGQIDADAMIRRISNDPLEGRQGRDTL